MRVFSVQILGFILFRHSVVYDLDPSSRENLVEVFAFRIKVGTNKMPMIVYGGKSRVHNHELWSVTENFSANFGKHVQSMFQSLEGYRMFVSLEYYHDSFPVSLQVLSSQNNEGTAVIVDFLFLQTKVAQRTRYSLQIASPLNTILATSFSKSFTV